MHTSLLRATRVIPVLGLPLLRSHLVLVYILLAAVVPGQQFKGVVMWNLQILQQAAPDEKFVAFIQKNADSVRNTARDATTNQLGSAWDGNATAQGAGLDALVAATAIFG
jgi:hypothetical protein